MPPGSTATPARVERVADRVDGVAVVGRGDQRETGRRADAGQIGALEEGDVGHILDRAHRRDHLLAFLNGEHLAAVEGLLERVVVAREVEALRDPPRRLRVGVGEDRALIAPPEGAETGVQQPGGQLLVIIGRVRRGDHAAVHERAGDPGVRDPVGVVRLVANVDDIVVVRVVGAQRDLVKVVRPPVPLDVGHVGFEELVVDDDRAGGERIEQLAVAVEVLRVGGQRERRPAAALVDVGDDVRERQVAVVGIPAEHRPQPQALQVHLVLFAIDRGVVRAVALAHLRGVGVVPPVAGPGVEPGPVARPRIGVVHAEHAPARARARLRRVGEVDAHLLGVDLRRPLLDQAEDVRVAHRAQVRVHPPEQQGDRRVEALERLTLGQRGLDDDRRLLRLALRERRVGEFRLRRARGAGPRRRGADHPRRGVAVRRPAGRGVVRQRDRGSGESNQDPRGGNPSHTRERARRLVRLHVVSSRVYARSMAVDARIDRPARSYPG
jgi:hypothetical protein